MTDIEIWDTIFKPAFESSRKDGRATRVVMRYQRMVEKRFFKQPLMAIIKMVGVYERLRVKATLRPSLWHNL